MPGCTFSNYEYGILLINILMRLTTNYNFLLLTSKLSTNNCAIQQLELRMRDQVCTAQNTHTHTTN